MLDLVDCRVAVLGTAQTIATAAGVTLRLLGIPQANQDVEAFATATLPRLRLSAARRGGLQRVEGVLGLEVVRSIGSNYHADFAILDAFAQALLQVTFEVLDETSGDGTTVVGHGYFTEFDFSELGPQDESEVMGAEVPFVIQETD